MHGQILEEEQQNLVQQIAEPQQQEDVEEVDDNLALNENLQIRSLQAFQMGNFLHHEISKDALMENAADLELDEQQEMRQEQPEGQNELIFQNNTQLGMVRTLFVNPFMDLTRTIGPTWLAPKIMNKIDGKDKALIEVPAKWLDFFQALLLALAQHSWAKQLLESGFPQLLRTGGDWTATVSMNCKPSSAEACTFLDTEPLGAKENEEALPEQLMEDSPPSKKMGRKARPDTPVIQ